MKTDCKKYWNKNKNKVNKENTFQLTYVVIYKDGHIFQSNDKALVTSTLDVECRDINCVMVKVYGSYKVTFIANTAYNLL